MLNGHSLTPSLPPPPLQFGKGIYFADMCSKSANYCFASRTRQEGLLVLCDVSLGTYLKLQHIIRVLQSENTSLSSCWDGVFIPFQVGLMTFWLLITMPTSSPGGNTVLKVLGVSPQTHRRLRSCTLVLRTAPLCDTLPPSLPCSVDGCLVPLGTSVNTGIHNPSGYTLNYNGQ